MYINVHSICIWRKHLVHDKSAPLLYHEQAFQQSLSYWHWVFCSQSQGFADKLLNIWLSGVPNRPWLIVIRVWELWDGFFEFSEQCTSMWRLKNSRVEWALELSLREAGDCWKVWWRWWPLVLVRAGGSVSVVCQARVCSRSQHPSSDLLTSYGLRCHRRQAR